MEFVVEGEGELLETGKDRSRGEDVRLEAVGWRADLEGLLGQYEPCVARDLSGSKDQAE